MPQSGGEMDAAIQPKEYAVAPEWRRSAWYVLLGLAVACGMVELLASGYEECAQHVIRDLLGAAFLVGCFAAVLAYRWRIRVDAVGISRRRLFRWHTWYWHEFRNAIVTWQPPWKDFLNKDRPFWNGDILLDFCTEKDATCLFSLCVDRLPQAALPEIPDSIVFRTPLFSLSRRVVRLDIHGINVACRGTHRFYYWEEVQAIFIQWRCRIERAPQRVRIELADQTFDLAANPKDYCKFVNYWGPRPDTVVAFLRRRVPSDRVTMWVPDRDPTSLAEIEDRLRATDQAMRRNTGKPRRASLLLLANALFWIFCGFIGVVGLLLSKPCLPAQLAWCLRLLLVALPVVLTAAAILIYRDQRVLRRRHEEERDKLLRLRDEMSHTAKDSLAD